MTCLVFECQRLSELLSTSLSLVDHHFRANSSCRCGCFVDLEIAVTVRALLIVLLVIAVITIIVIAIVVAWIGGCEWQQR